MFCPNCKAEYRAGFTTCSDCGVNLVERLSDGSNAPVEPVGDPEAMEVTWAGQDARIYRMVEEALDKAQIAHEDDSVQSGLLPAFQQSIHRIRTRRGDHEAVEKALQELREVDPPTDVTPTDELQSDGALVNPFGSRRRLLNRAPEEDSGQDFNSAEDEKVDDVGADFFPEDATREVWCGEDPEVAENIRVCLREVAIGCEVRERNAESRVFVKPQAEARAREIIREVIEAAPPE
jgi:hypothetical protein